MKKHHISQIPLRQAEDYKVAEAVISYPSGKPFVLKGERITRGHIKVIE